MADQHQPPPHDDNWGPETPWQEPFIAPQQPPPSQSSPPSSPPPDAEGRQQQWGAGVHKGRAGAPSSYLTPAILVTLFCFLPTGIAAIVFASQVQSKWTVGDFAGAAEASRKARLFVIVSVAVGFLAWVVFLAIGFASGPSTTTAPTP